MDLSTILTYFGLLITAFGATQEYIRLKLKLAPKLHVFLFAFSLGLLYISTLEFVRQYLTVYGVLHFPNGISHYLWEAKYLFILSINLMSLYFILQASKLTPANEQEFLDLIHDLRGSKNYSILHKLIYENLDVIFSLKYEPTFAERTSRRRGAKHLNAIMAQLGIENNPKPKFFELMWEKITSYIYIQIAKFSYRKEVINEIFQYCISDKLIMQSIAESNEPLGIEILKQILKHDAFDSKFINRFLIIIFKNRDSYIYKEYILKQSGKIHEFFEANQRYEKGLDLGLNIAFAILEQLEDNTEFLSERYEDNHLNSLFKHISELFEALGKIDPEQSHYSNLPYYIEKVLLKNIDLSEEKESVGFHFLNSLFSTFQELNEKSNGLHIEVLNSLYSSFADKAEDANADYLIRIGCHYIDYMFNDFNIEHIDSHVQQFKDSIEKTWKSDLSKLCEIFLLVLNKRRGRGDCEDWTAYTHVGVNTKISENWDSVTEFLQEKIRIG